MTFTQIREKNHERVRDAGRAATEQIVLCDVNKWSPDFNLSAGATYAIALELHAIRLMLDDLVYGYAKLSTAVEGT